MKLTVLGCSGSVPGPESPASGYLVQHEGYSLLLDLGHGAFGALQRHLAPTAVDAIVISHLHSDHCIDLTAYVVALRYGEGAAYRREGDGRRITLIGPSGTRDRLEAANDPLARKQGLQQLFGFSTPADTQLGPFELSFAAVKHPTPTNAVRISCGDRSLVYSADTGESGELVTLARGADVLLCEASVGPDQEQVPDLHLTGRQAGEHATRAGVGRLILTHIPPWVDPAIQCDEANAAFRGPVELAAPDREFLI